MFCSFGRIILESDPVLITQRVQLRQDDIPLGEQTVSQVSFEGSREHSPSSHSTLINAISSCLSIRFSIRASICSSTVIDRMKHRSCCACMQARKLALSLSLFLLLFRFYPSLDADNAVYLSSYF